MYQVQKRAGLSFKWRGPLAEPILTENVQEEKNSAIMAKWTIAPAIIVLLYTLNIMKPTSGNPCQVGSIYVNRTNMCELCQMGSYSNLAQATVCSLCKAGQFSPEIGASGCHLCNPGKFSRKHRDIHITFLTKTWFDAAQDCNDRGTQLVTIDSKDQNDKVLDMIDSTIGLDNSKLWIGFSQQNSSTKWAWISGSDSNYSNWASDPLLSDLKNTYHGKCAMIISLTLDETPSSQVGTWRYVDCNDQSVGGFICESPFYSGPTSCISCISGKHSTD
jgi:hypothetical protein